MGVGVVVGGAVGRLSLTQLQNEVCEINNVFNLCMCGCLHGGYGD